MFKQLARKLLIVKYYLLSRYFRKFKNRSSLIRWQNKKINYFLKNLPKDNYYRKRIEDNAQFEDWQSWPLVDKQEMMKHFNTLNTVGIKKDVAMRVAMDAETNRNILPQVNGITVGLSSGTSGHRGLFLVSSEERWQWAGFLLAKVLKKSLLKPQKIALFLRANSKLYESLNQGSIQFSFFDMIQPIPSYSDALTQFNPDILIAPPSVLRQLAQLKTQSRLPITPEQIYSVAEVLDPIDEQYIQQIFAQKIGQIYQATEGFLGITCAHGNLHLNEDLLIIEKDYLDKKRKKFCPIITDFSRTSQPILRYKLNDILTESDSLCPCGSVNTVITMIEGRCDDLVTLYSKNSDFPAVIFPDFIRQAILRCSIDIDEYLVIHSDINVLKIGIRYKDQSDDNHNKLHQMLIEELDNMALEHHCKPATIEFIEYPDLVSTSLRKMKRIVKTY